MSDRGGSASARGERHALLLLCAAAVLGSLLLAEAVTRLLTRRDEDGGLYVRSLRLLPYRMPVEAVRRQVADYHAAGDESYIRADPELGWTVRADARSRDGLYLSDRLGLRSPVRGRATALAPAPGVLRIALFGDSFTHGNDVRYEDSWAAVLAERLTARGVAAEVLNFGVGGFAVDQAYLRWRRRGRELSPAVVVFGFQSSNCKRNLNLLRVLYSPDTGLVFSKPRLVLDGPGLRTINQPTVEPDALPALLADFASWQYSRDEWFYRPQDYVDRALFASRLVAFLWTGIQTGFSSRRREVDFFAEGGVPRTLCERIVDTFAREVEEAGLSFLIVHLPARKSLQQVMQGGDFEHRAMLESLRARHALADPTDELVAFARREGIDALFARDGGHYSPAGYRLVGEQAARWIGAPPDPVARPGR